jgi:hypothetical protein
MNGWEIYWSAEEWRIEYRPSRDLLIVAEYDDELVEQDPICVYRVAPRLVKVSWPWPYPESPAPDTVIDELRRIAAEYLGDNPK